MAGVIPYQPNSLDVVPMEIADKDPSINVTTRGKQTLRKHLKHERPLGQQKDQTNILPATVYA